MGSSEIEQILTAVNSQRKALDTLNVTVCNVDKRLAIVETKMSEPVDASRLRWGTREIMLIFMAIIVPAMSAYYGAKSQTDITSELLTTHIAKHDTVTR